MKLTKIAPTNGEFYGVRVGSLLTIHRLSFFENDVYVYNFDHTWAPAYDSSTYLESFDYFLIKEEDIKNLEEIYELRTPDYTGCDPEVAECLKDGLYPRCIFKKRNSKMPPSTVTVVGYFDGYYLTDDDDYSKERYTVKIKKKTKPYVKPFLEVIEILEGKVEEGELQFFHNRKHPPQYIDNSCETIFSFEWRHLCGKENTEASNLPDYLIEHK